MTSAELLTDAFGRVHEEVHRVLDGVSDDDLAARLDPDANSIGWLIWHLTRVQDDHIAGVAGLEQAWTSGGWADRFALPFDQADIGYGHTSAQVGAVKPTAQLLAGYHDAVHEQTVRYVSALTDNDLPHVVDENWDPPVTLAVRLVSVIGDTHQHVGQAAFIRGVLERR